MAPERPRDKVLRCGTFQLGSRTLQPLREGSNPVPGASEPLIAVVDDDADIRSVVEHGLRSVGYRCVTASDGASALKLIGPSEPALVVLDIHLPDMHGLEVLDALRAEPRTEEIPVVLLTADNRIDQVVEGLGRGAIDFVRKPFHLDELAARIASALRQSEVRDVDRRARRFAEVRAHVDPVTGGANRSHVEERLHREWERAVLVGFPLSVLLIDVDGFKALNDSRGHAAGDRALAELGGLLRSKLRREDAFGRWGGDEFAAVVPNLAPREAAKVAARLTQACVDWSTDGQTNLTISCGVACAAPPLGRSAKDLVAAADRALYEAKRAGPGSFRVAEV